MKSMSTPCPPGKEVEKNKEKEIGKEREREDVCGLRPSRYGHNPLSLIREAKEVVKRIPRKDSGRVEKCTKKIRG